LCKWFDKASNEGQTLQQRTTDAIDRLILEEFLQQSVAGVDHTPEIPLLARESTHCNFLKAQKSVSFQQFKAEFLQFTDDIRLGAQWKKAQFWIQYRDCVADLLRFLQAVKEHNFELYALSIHQLCSLLFSSDRHNYARYLPLCYVQLMLLPAAAEAMMHNSGFSVSRSKVPCCRIPVDMTIEQMMNCSAKTTGGIIGFSHNPDANYRCQSLVKSDHYI